MKPKLFVNFGLPKTSSTNLQANFYPNIKNLNYLGRNQQRGLEGNSEIFKELNYYIEQGQNVNFTEEKIEILKTKFKKNLKNKVNLISMENWAFPYQRNVKTNKIEIMSQFKKLTRLKNFIESLKIEHSFFVVHRNQIDGIVSLFVTAQNRIEKIFGAKYLHFKNFLNKYSKNDKDHENIKLLFDVYNKNKIKEIFKTSELKIFNYIDIKKNPEKFIKEFFNYVNLEADYSLVDKLKIITGKTPSIKGNYFIGAPNYLFMILKKITPNFLKNKLKFILLFSPIKRIFIKKSIITKEDISRLENLLKIKNK